MEKWLNKTLKMGFVVIFYFLFTEENFPIKHFLRK